MAGRKITHLKPEELGKYFARKLTPRMARRAMAMDRAEARAMIQTYRSVKRLALAMRQRARTHGGDNVLEWAAAAEEETAGVLKAALEVWLMCQPTGPWLLSVFGVGAITGATFAAYIDPTKTPSQMRAACGLAPGRKSCIRELRGACYSLAVGWVRAGDRPDNFYGRHYRIALERFRRKNQEREYTAKTFPLLARFPNAKPATIETLKAGLLPARVINNMALRQASRVFVDDYAAACRTMPLTP